MRTIVLQRDLAGPFGPFHNGVMKSPCLILLAVAAALGACSPGLDWREVRPEGAGVLALFPCKPTVSQRAPTQSNPAHMGLAQCSAAGASFSLAWSAVAEPSQVAPALRQMRESLAGKLAAKPGVSRPIQVPGMTPNLEAQTQSLMSAADRPGTVLPLAQVAVFSKGLQVYQLVMMGGKPGDEAWENFSASVRVAR
jgi:hypothetical protein